MCRTDFTQLQLINCIYNYLSFVDSEIIKTIKKGTKHYVELTYIRFGCDIFWMRRVMMYLTVYTNVGQNLVNFVFVP